MMKEEEASLISGIRLITKIFKNYHSDTFAFPDFEDEYTLFNKSLIRTMRLRTYQEHNPEPSQVKIYVKYCFLTIVYCYINNRLLSRNNRLLLYQQ